MIIYQNGASGIDDVSARGRFGITTVDGRKQKFLLQMCAPMDVFFILLICIYSLN